ncbi:MAG: DUF1467 family protein [Pseudomonadota bacterium]
MNIAGGIVVFVIVWWCVFFAVLPWGVRNLQESGEMVEGAEPGAPARPGLWPKIAITTGLAAFVWLIVFAIIGFQLIDLRSESPL